MIATGGLFPDFLEARSAWFSANTYAAYDAALKLFAAFLAERNPTRKRLSADLLTADALETWFGSMVFDGCSIATARLRVTAVRSAWAWAYESATYGDLIARPRKIAMPSPLGRPVRAPTWAEMDAAIHAAYQLADQARHPVHRRHWVWKARTATLLRFTGLRIDTQAMALDWADIDLERGELSIRGELGKSKRERSGRIVPISAHLVAELATWGVREGPVLAPHNSVRESHAFYLRRMWSAAKVPAAVWEDRPHHAFRRGFKTGLARAGVESDVRDFLVGHHRGIDAHYIDAWQAAREAVDQIPPVVLAALPDNVHSIEPGKAHGGS